MQRGELKNLEGYNSMSSSNVLSTSVFFSSLLLLIEEVAKSTLAPDREPDFQPGTR